MPESVCPLGDANEDGQIDISELLQAVNNALNGCPGPTPTPTLTPTTTEIRYRLTAGSAVRFVGPTPDCPSCTSAPLSGTFAVVRTEADAPPNTAFQFTITTVAFDAPGFSVTDAVPGPFGCGGEMSLGCIEATTLDHVVYMFVVVTINGQRVGLDGFAPLDYSPGVLNLEACGAAADEVVHCDAIQGGLASGYDLTIFAVRE